MKTTTAAEKPGILINRNFAWLWLGQIISPVGDFFLTTTLILWITLQLARGQSWIGLAVSGVALAASLATLVVGSLAGVFIDRWDKRRTMLRMDLARGLLILALMVLTGLLPAPLSIQLPLPGKLGVIYSILLLCGACSQFFGPARWALLGDIVEKEQRPRASGMFQAAFNIALILGPMLAAPLFLAFGARWAMLIDAASFFISYLCVWLMKAPPAAHSVNQQTKSNYLSELRAGWQCVIKSRALTALIVIGILLFIGAGTTDAFYLLFTLDNLHAPTNLIGLFGPAYGAGVILASLPAAWLARRLGEGRQLALAVLFWGLLTILLSRLTSFMPGILTFGLMGMVNGYTNVCIGPLLLHLTPREFVGRVNAIMTPSITLASTLSAALSGYLISGPLFHLHHTLPGMSFGALDSVFLGAGVIVVLAGIYGIQNLGAISARDSSEEPQQIEAESENLLVNT